MLDDKNWQRITKTIAECLQRPTGPDAPDPRYCESFDSIDGAYADAGRKLGARVRYDGRGFEGDAVVVEVSAAGFETRVLARGATQPEAMAAGLASFLPEALREQQRRSKSAEG